MAIDITKGIEPFEDRMDFTRNNPDRKPFGSKGTDQFDVRSEFDVAAPTPSPDPPPVTPPPVTPAPKFTHKLANGTVLEADSVEGLAAQIEKALVQTPAPPPAEFEDKPVYQPLEFKRKELSLAEQVAILNEWKENPQKALRKLEEAEYGHPMEVVLGRLTRAEQNELFRQQEIAGVEFLEECETFNSTPANAKKLTEYLKTKGKPITKQNLVLSFQQLVAAGDKTLLRKADEQPPAESAAATEELTEAPPPPVIVPSNQGRPETPAPGAVDVAKFASMSLDQQKKYFADLRRRP